MNSQDLPRFKHNHCSKCRFVCQARESDVWICHGEDSLIERYGSQPSQYGSQRRTIYRDNRLPDDNRPFTKIWDILVDNPDWCGKI